MKQLLRGKPEGWLMAALLGIAALACLLVWANRLPQSIALEPVSSVSAEQLATPAPALLDLNCAGREELAFLPGIGEELADRILQYRAENGPFKSVKELDNVPGIGEGKLAAIESLVFCG